MPSECAPGVSGPLDDLFVWLHLCEEAITLLRLQRCVYFDVPFNFLPLTKIIIIIIIIKARATVAYWGCFTWTWQSPWAGRMWKKTCRFLFYLFFLIKAARSSVEGTLPLCWGASISLAPTPSTHMSFLLSCSARSFSKKEPLLRSGTRQRQTEYWTFQAKSEQTVQLAVRSSYFKERLKSLPFLQPALSRLHLVYVGQHVGSQVR